MRLLNHVERYEAGSVGLAEWWPGGVTDACGGKDARSKKR
jgi:hypothetical protein